MEGTCAMMCRAVTRVPCMAPNTGSVHSLGLGVWNSGYTFEDEGFDTRLWDL